MIATNHANPSLRGSETTETTRNPSPSSLRGSGGSHNEAIQKIDCHESLRDSRNDKGEIMLTEKERTEQLIKPILRGRDIKRYSYEWAGLWLIGTFPALKLNIDDYPALKKYLENFMPRIAQSGEKGCRKKTSNKWFETQDNIAYYEDFEKEKIVWNPVSGEYFFAHIQETMFFNNSLFMMTDASEPLSTKTAQAARSGELNSANDKLLYILGLMNSALYKWLITQMTNLVETGKYAYGAKDKIEKLPIPQADLAAEVEFVELVRQIVSLKKAGHETAELEKRLDKMVCKLYNLNEVEENLVLSLSLSGFVINFCDSQQSTEVFGLCA